MLDRHNRFDLGFSRNLSRYFSRLRSLESHGGSKEILTHGEWACRRIRRKPNRSACRRPHG
ncbi:hypothetical protein PCAR4_410086 [Paraburkholderia caribensis]|nr:hypothetical protein PCAR4_410086 [Paraburkholderia caribensis]